MFECYHEKDVAAEAIENAIREVIETTREIEDNLSGAGYLFTVPDRIHEAYTTNHPPSLKEDFTFFVLNATSHFQLSFIAAGLSFMKYEPLRETLMSLPVAKAAKYLLSP